MKCTKTIFFEKVPGKGKTIFKPSVALKIDSRDRNKILFQLRNRILSVYNKSVAEILRDFSVRR